MSNKLTIKQEKFCLEYLKDGNASRAYREAYDTGNMKEATINRNAKALTDDNKIATRIDELRAKAEDDGIMSIKELQKFWSSVARNQLADDEPKLNDRLKASELLGKSKAAFIEKRETELSTPSGTIFQINLQK